MKYRNLTKLSPNYVYPDDLGPSTMDVAKGLYYMTVVDTKNNVKVIQISVASGKVLSETLVTSVYKANEDAFAPLWDPIKLVLRLVWRLYRSATVVVGTLQIGKISSSAFTSNFNFSVFYDGGTYPTLIASKQLLMVGHAGVESSISLSSGAIAKMESAPLASADYFFGQWDDSSGRFGGFALSHASNSTTGYASMTLGYWDAFGSNTWTPAAAVDPKWVSNTGLFFPMFYDANAGLFYAWTQSTKVTGYKTALSAISFKDGSIVAQGQWFQPVLSERI
jgi:hypothetical protein